MLTARDLATVNHARALLISHCMEAHGLDFNPGELRDEVRRTVLSERRDLSRLYGITDADAAAVYGYMPAPIPVPDPPRLPEDRAYWVALTGQNSGSTTGPNSRTGGCAGAADARLNRQPDRSAYGSARELWIRNQTTLRQTSAWNRVVNDWQQCMAAEGYQVTSPLEDEGDIRTIVDQRDGRASPTPEELLLAATDIRCKRDVRLTSRVGRIAWAMDSRTVDERASVLRTDQRLNEAQVALARRITKASGARPLGGRGPDTREDS